MKLLLLFLAITIPASSCVTSRGGKQQSLLETVSNFDFDRAEKRVLKKARKLMKTPKDQELFVFTYFPVALNTLISEINENPHLFLSYFSLFQKFNCFVYDESKEVVATVFDTRILPFPSFRTAYLYIEHIERLKPEFVFEYIYSPAPFPLFLCYKDNDIIVVHSSDDHKRIISTPLSEFENWDWFQIKSK